MTKISEALVRQNQQDIIYIGEVAERLYNGAGGELLRAIIHGKVTLEARRYKDEVNTPADRCLGRIEAFSGIIDAIEQAIEDGKELNRPLTEEEIEDEQARLPS